MSSDSEEDHSDYEQLQQQLLSRLDSFLDDEIGERSQKSKLTKKKKTAEITKKKASLENTTQSETTNSQSRKELGFNNNNIVENIKKHSSNAAHDRKHSTSAKLAQQKQKIKEKVNRLTQPKSKTKSTQNSNSVELHSDNEQESENEDTDFSDNSDVDNNSDEFSEGSFDDGDDDIVSESNQLSKSTGSGRQIEKFKQVLGITDSDIQQAKEQKNKDAAGQGACFQQVQTVGLMKLKKKRPSLDLVVFEDPAKRKKKLKDSKRKVGASLSKHPNTSGDDEDEMGPEFDIKRARFEVRKFGVRGLEGGDKEAGLVDMLVNLGAQRPKKTNMNYKDLQEQKKQEIIAAEKKRELDRKTGFRVVNPNKKKSSRRDRNDVGLVDGQIGSYRGGIQVIDKQNIEQVNRKKGRRK